MGKSKTELVTALGLDAHYDCGEIQGNYIDMVVKDKRQYTIKIPVKVVDGSEDPVITRFEFMKCAVDAWIDGMNRMKGGN